MKTVEHFFLSKDGMIASVVFLFSGDDVTPLVLQTDA